MSAIEIQQIDNKTTSFKFTNGSLDVIVRHGDLTQEPCDAIVNPTQSSMIPDGGLDEQIHETMGQFFTDQVIATHRDGKKNSCPVGQSRIFIAKFDSDGKKPRYVISTVGPEYSEEEKGKAAHLLESCYDTTLTLANLYELESVAFPAISCGKNGFCHQQAAGIAIKSVRRLSRNIKTIRFVLSELPMYETFVREWTDYANEINRETHGTDQSNETTGEMQETKSDATETQIKTTETITETTEAKTETPDITSGAPQTTSEVTEQQVTVAPIRWCALCNAKQLPIDRQFQCDACNQMSRSKKFRKILMKLRGAGGRSMDNLVEQCEKFQPILKQYPLNYNPAQVFDNTIHFKDNTSSWYLENYCDKDLSLSHLPLTIIGDGNCFYNTFLKLGGVHTYEDEAQLTAIELRARNVIELTLNREAYKTKYDNLSMMLDDIAKYITTEMVNDSRYTSICDFLSMATVLNIRLVAVYPKVNGDSDLIYQTLNRYKFLPLNTNLDISEDQHSSVAGKEVKVLCSSCAKPAIKLSGEKVEWTPNHFVPLLQYLKK